MSRTSQPKGVVCNRTFDKYACWPDGLPNTIVNVSCPWYLPWYNTVQDGFVFRKCGPDGNWVMDSIRQPWRDSSQCKDDPKDDRAQTAAGCRTAQVLMQYCIGANYYWLLIEGIYLHNLLVIAVFSEKSYFNIYLCIGWGAPVLFVVPWVVVKYLYENTG
ncbi:hypothetical protein chiPu_0019622 [Chiloscyllium punctatum]|uniref:G-protein coupled receptors family 2 profile 2 domain-containing protein n=1 Tax=Chiloscyllium punctatum TaxID=137246 RepID=A0A401RSM7_CHIPU|nr:hypothetical protein [Chiloscyllium punctatum]